VSTLQGQRPRRRSLARSALSRGLRPPARPSRTIRPIPSTDRPTVSRPWLRRMQNFLLPSAAAMRLPPSIVGSNYLVWEGKRGRESFQERFGRPREFIVDSSPSCFATLITQSSFPKGRPRCALERRLSSSDSLSDPFTNSIQSFGRSIGHSFRKSDVFPSARRNRYKLDRCQYSARPTNPARRALRSTYLATVTKCSSV